MSVAWWAVLALVVALAVGVFAARGRGACRVPEGAIAAYCRKTDTFAIDERRLRADLECGFCYFRRPSTPSGRQKEVVFARMGDPGGVRLERWVNAHADKLEAYRRFVEAHERAHQRLHRDVRLAGGLLSEGVLRVEVEANEAAYAELGI